MLKCVLYAIAYWLFVVVTLFTAIMLIVFMFGCSGPAEAAAPTSAPAQRQTAPLDWSTAEPGRLKMVHSHHWPA